MMARLFLLLLALHFLPLQAKPGREFIAADIRETMQQGDKLAILMVHFGSAYPEARAALDETNRQVRRAFSGIEVRQAYSARSLVNRVQRQGVFVQHTTDALVTLRNEGFTHVVVQPTIVIEGLEMEALRKEVARRQGLFKDIRIGNPLLYDDEDYEAVIKAITSSPVHARKGVKLLIANGTYHASNSAYAKLGYMFQAEGFPTYLLGTREGFPTIDTVLKQLSGQPQREVTLIPFMFVLIKAKENAVSAFWKEQLEANGYEAVLYARGLGDYPGIQQLCQDHIRFAMKYRRIGVEERKRMFGKM